MLSWILFICLMTTAHAKNWTVTGSLTYARCDHTATLLTNGNVLVAGGIGENSAEVYNASTGVWTVTGSLTYARYYHTATLLRNGNVLVAGENRNTATELYNLTTGVWTVTGSLTYARYDHTATLLLNGNVLVAGGYNNGYLNSAELYNPTTGVWTVTGSLTYARRSHTATLLPNGNVLVVGGHGKSAELYNATTGVWTVTGNVTYARRLNTATLLPNGNVLVAGGLNDTYLNSAELYNPTTGIWTLTGSLTYVRYDHTATLLLNGNVLVAGGLNDTYLNSAELYNPTTGIWTLTGSLTYTRDDHTATLLPSGNVLVAGGYNHLNFLKSAEIFNSTATAITTATATTRTPTPTSTPTPISTSITPATTTLVPTTPASTTTVPTTSTPTTPPLTAHAPTSTAPTNTPTTPIAPSPTSSSTGLTDAIPTPSECSVASSSSHDDAIAGGIIGGLVGLVLILLFLWLFRFATGSNSVLSKPGLKVNEIPRRDLTKDTKLNEGNFGIVWRGTYTGIPVAIKEPKLDGDPDLIPSQQLADLVEEATVMTNVSVHPNVLHCYGISRVGENDYLLATELCNLGSLESFLRAYPGTSAVDRRRFSQQVARGLNHLCKHNVVHRDVVARNVLLHDQGGVIVAKVCDFGLSRQRQGEYYKLTGHHLLSPETAPEVFSTGKHSSRSDVWSFGVLLWEVESLCTTRAKPNKAVFPPLSRPAQASDKIDDIMRKCWAKDPYQRPSFEALIDMLA